MWSGSRSGCPVVIPATVIPSATMATTDATGKRTSRATGSLSVLPRILLRNVLGRTGASFLQRAVIARARTEQQLLDAVAKARSLRSQSVVAAPAWVNCGLIRARSGLVLNSRSRQLDLEKGNP